MRAIGESEVGSQPDAAMSIGLGAGGFKEVERLERLKIGELGVAGWGVGEGERDEWLSEDGELAAGERLSEAEGDAR